MIAIIDDNRDELFALCRKHRVRKLELFGSATTGEFDPDRSDLDFLVEFDRPEGTNAFHQYFDFLFEVEKLLGRKVDLVEPSCMKNPYFIASVNETRRPLYAA
jgi:predicted nucleotidyltransferase